MSAIKPRGAGPRKRTQDSSTSTSSTGVVTSPPGNSPNSSRKRFGPRSGRFARWPGASNPCASLELHNKTGPLSPRASSPRCRSNLAIAETTLSKGAKWAASVLPAPEARRLRCGAVSAVFMPSMPCRSPELSPRLRVPPDLPQPSSSSGARRVSEPRRRLEDCRARPRTP